MLGPYRSLADVVDNPCDAPTPGGGHCLGCGRLAPQPSRFAACIDASPARAPNHASWGSALRAVSSLLFGVTLVFGVALGPMTFAGLTRLSGACHKGKHAPPAGAEMVVAPPQAARPATIPAVAPARHVEQARAALLPSPLAQLGHETHDPRELHRRAARVAAAGLDVTVRASSLSADEAQAKGVEALSFGARVTPAHRDGRVIGIHLFGIRAGSTAEALGLRSGDILKAVNGYVMDSSDSAFLAYELAREGRGAVLEIERGGQPEVIAIDWR